MLPLTTFSFPLSLLIPSPALCLFFLQFPLSLFSLPSFPSQTRPISPMLSVSLRLCGGVSSCLLCLSPLSLLVLSGRIGAGRAALSVPRLGPRIRIPSCVGYSAPSPEALSNSLEATQTTDYHCRKSTSTIRLGIIFRMRAGESVGRTDYK